MHTHTHAHLLTVRARLAESDRALQTSIGSVNADNDLSLYSAKHGIDMPFNIDAQPEPWTPAKT
jgi:hypothetical protein